MSLNLTELQVELRAIEKRLAQLHQAIEEMKPATRKCEDVNFSEITKRAKEHPITHLDIIKAPNYIQKMFIMCLAYLLQVDANDTEIYSKLLYICRIAEGCHLAMNADDVYLLGMEFEKTNVENVSHELYEYRYSYLIEALFIANLSEEVSVNILTMITDMAALMKCDKEEVCMMAQVAKARLISNWDILNDVPLSDRKRWSGQLKEYIPKEWIEAQRQNCGKFYEPNPMSISLTFNREDKKYITSSEIGEIYKQRNGTYVQKGDILFTYYTKGNEMKMRAPKDGIFYFVSKMQSDKNYIYMVYISSIFDSFEDLRKLK